jgi:dephospho-CoA kinase
MAEDEELKNKITNSFGNESYTKGVLNRQYLSSLVFNDKEKLKLLNSLVHPATIKDATEWMKRQRAPYILKEAALIFESGFNTLLDYVIGVKAPLSLRLERTMERDDITSKDVEARMNLQMNEEEKMKRCDFIILNDEKEMLIPQVLALHEKFNQQV